MSKTYILSLEGICVGEDEIENTTIHICRNGEWCEIPFDIDDIPYDIINVIGEE